MSLRGPTLLFCVLAPVATAHAETCHLEGMAIPRMVVNVQVEAQRFEPYLLEDFSATAELVPDGADFHVRSPIDFLGSTTGSIDIFTRRRVSLADGAVEIAAGVRLTSREQGGRIVFDGWLGPLHVVDLSLPCDALSLDRSSEENPSPAPEVRPLEQRSFKLGTVGLSPAPGADPTVRMRVISPESTVDVFERRGPWRRVRFRSFGVRLSGWIRDAALGPLKRLRGAWGSGPGGVMCDRPPLPTAEAVRATIDPGTIVLIGSPQGREMGKVTSRDVFEVELDPNRTTARIRRAHHMVGACAPEARDGRIDSLWVPVSAVHREPELTAVTSALNFLDSIRGADSLAFRWEQEGNTNHWTVVAPNGKIECVGDNSEFTFFRCEEVDSAGHRKPTPTPAWAHHLEALHGAPLAFAESVGGFVAFDLDDELHLALRAPDGEWLLTPKLAAGVMNDSRIDEVQTLAQSDDGRERLMRLVIGARAGTRWHTTEERLVYLRIAEAQVLADSLRVAYGEAFDHNELFAQPRGRVFQTNRVDAQSPRAITVRPQSKNLKQLRFFCPKPDVDTCNAEELRAVGESVGRWKIENDHFVRAP
jgi:hypothetical protein